MALKELKGEDLILSYTFERGTKDTEPEEFFPGQDRVKRAFDLFLNSKFEGYNLYVVGPEGIGRTTYTLSRIREKARLENPPEDICYVNNFDDPTKPKYLLLPAGMGRSFANHVDRAIEHLKEEMPKAFESKDFEEEVARITKDIELQKEATIKELAESAKQHGLGVVFTPAGIKLLPLLGKRLITEEELYENSRLQESYQRSVEEFEESFREYLRRLRELDHILSDALLQLRINTARYVVDKVFSRFEERYIPFEGVASYIERLKEELSKSAHLFLSWHASKGDFAFQRHLEKSFNLFRVNVLVDNSSLRGAPVVFEEYPTFQNLFGRVFYTAEMGVLYADHMSISAGSLHRARGGYLILRTLDLFKHPFLWDAFKKVLLHKKIHTHAHPVEEVFLPYVGISPEPLPSFFKAVLIGDAYSYYLLYELDPEFRRLFKVKAEFNPIVEVDNNLVEKFPKIVSKITKEEGLKEVSADGLSELFKYGVELSGRRDRFNMVMGNLVDVLREAHNLSEDEVIDAKDIRRAIKERIYRSNLIEEKIRKAIVEGKIIVELEGERVGQVNGLSVYELGDISFGKPSRITASVYIGERGIVNIEREVELSGPIHSKGVLILTGYIGRQYGGDFPLHLSCTITFEQSYDEVEGDSASVAELLAILSAIAGVPVKQYIAITGSVDQMGNVQPVGGIKEKVEGFYKVCKAIGLKGVEGVVVPSRNYENLVLDEEVIQSVLKGEFHIYLADKVDDVIELTTGMKASKFHELVKKRLWSFYNITIQRRKRA